MRLVSRNDGSGWFLFRVWGRSDRVARPRRPAQISRPNCRGDPEWMKNALATKCDDQQAITEVTDAYGNVTEIKAKKTHDLGVLKCRGAFTPSRRFVSRRAGRGWSVF